MKKTVLKVSRHSFRTKFKLRLRLIATIMCHGGVNTANYDKTDKEIYC